MTETQYCRLCAELRPKSDILEIRDVVATNLNLEYKIFHCFHLQIENDDKLPKTVCSECCEQVVTTYEFNEKVQRAQELLWTIVNQSDEKIEVKLEDSVNDNNSNVDNKLLVPVDLAQCIFKNDSDDFANNDDYSDIKQEESDLSDLDDVPLYKRKLRNSKNLTKFKQKSNNSKESLSSTDIQEDRIQKKSRIQKILEEWKNYKWNCVKCTDQLTSSKDLAKHYSEIHNLPPLYKCMDCSKVHEKYELFKKHVRAHRNKYKFRCDICGKYSYKRAHHDRHVETHSIVCKYMCSTCGKSFKTQGSLYSHTRMHLPVELKHRYECDICKKRFSSAANLTSHKKIHTGIKDYTCDQCGKNFTQKVNLVQHINSKHTDETPFRCDLCPKAFKTVYRLKSHQTLHTNIRPYKCETCGKAFREKGMMKAHAKIHSTEFPFECEYCKKCFKLKAFLKIHLRQHTGERPYSCKDCDHHFTNWSNYSKHMNGRHGINVKSATTQFLQQQRLQLQLQQEESQQNSNQEEEDIKMILPTSESITIPKQIFE